MTWRENLRPPSFRGVPFHVEEHKAGPYGRRGPLHLYPLRDDGYFEDLGAKVPEFRISAYVDGDDYMQRRDRLIEACHRAGPGTLVHPYLGELEVVCTDCTPGESVPEGRIARFDLVFILAGRNRYPSAAVDTRAAVVARGAAVTQATLGRLTAVLDVVGPDFLATTATAIVQDAAAALLGQLGGSGQVLAQAVRTVTGLANEAASLVRNPAALGQRLVQSFASTVGLLEPARALSAMEELARFAEDRGEVPKITPTREQQAANEATLLATVRRQGVVEAATAATRMEFVSYDDAARTRERVTDLVDSEIASAGRERDDAGFLALKALYAAASRDLTARGATLARVTTYVPRATLPAVVVAYGLYGDASRAAEIVARNRIRHPGFVPGGQALEILADG